MRRVRFAFPLLMLSAIAIAAGCGGGGGGATPFVSPAPTATLAPHAGPTTIPVNPTASPQTVFLTGGGYTLGFTVPPVTNGSTSTMSAVLQTTLPGGVNAPQAHSKAQHMVSVKPMATTFTALAYLVVSTADTVGFSSAPSFQFTAPSGAIPSGANVYVLFWDPYVGPINNWINLLGPGRISGTTVTFPGVPTGVTLNANAQYIYALAVTSQSVPTATPAPTPTPASSPGTPPAYCNGIHPAANPGQKVLFTDNSGSGGVVVFYVATGTQYLNASGQMVNWSSGTLAQPFPLTCFPGSIGESGTTFELPVASGGRMYVALATSPPAGATSPPNPLMLEGNGSGYVPPDNKLGGFYPLPTPPNAISTYTSTPWDYVEFSLPGGVTDVTQVDQVGLPLELTQSGVSVGFGPGQYENLASGLSTSVVDSNYKKLVINGTFNGRAIVSRIVSPNTGPNWGFPQDWFYNSSYNTSYAPNPPNRGYLGYVLAQYKTNPQLYTLLGTNSTATPTTNDNYCVQSDGLSSFTFLEIGSSTTCTTSTTVVPGGKQYTMPVYNTIEAFPNASGGGCQSAIFAMPPGGPGGPLADNNEFYLWKAMVIELARGTALQPAPNGHPISTWLTGRPFPAGAPTPPPFSVYFEDPAFDAYAQLVHANMIGNNSYALQYDEPGALAPTLTGPSSASGPPLQITLQNLPSAVGPMTVVPTATATPMVCPSS